MNIRNRVAGLLACLGVLSVSGTGAANAADAPAFPTKPVSIVVPYAAARSAGTTATATAPHRGSAISVAVSRRAVTNRVTRCR